MPAPTYANADDLADRLGISQDDDRGRALEQAIAAASRWIETQLGGRRFYTVSETRYYSPQWTYRSHGDFPWGNPERPNGGGYANPRIVIDDLLVLTVDDALVYPTVATDQDGDGTYETTWTLATDFWLGPRNAPAKGQPYRTLNRNLATGRYAFPAWEDSIAVTGAFGFASAVPEPIRELCLYVGELFARDVVDLAIPGVQTYKLGQELSVTMSPTDLPSVYQKTLEDFRDTPMALL